MITIEPSKLHRIIDWTLILLLIGAVLYANGLNIYQPHNTIKIVEVCNLDMTKIKDINGKVNMSKITPFIIKVRDADDKDK